MFHRALCIRYQVAISFVVIAMSAVLTSRSFAENWNQWRGPQGTGVTPARTALRQWDRDTNVAWRYPLPEPGNSTPVVWDDRVFITQPYQDENMRAVICLDRASGKKRWERKIEYAQQDATHNTNFYCSASPVTDGQRVIVWFGSGGLVCFDMDGNPIWKRDLGPQQHMWGYGTSPVLYDQLCILSFGPGEHEQLIAVDKHTGETVWSVAALADDEELALSGHENDGNASPPKDDDPRTNQLRGSWGTPILVPDNNRMLVVVNHPRRISAYDTATGEVVWTCGGTGPLAYASPMFADGVVVALGGYFGGSLAVRAGGQDLVTDTHRLWHKPRDGSWLGTGVVKDGHLFISDMKAILHCIAIDTGEIKWKERLKQSSGRGGSWSSLTMTDDGVAYLLTKSGDTFVFSPSPDGYQQIARNSLEESSNSTVVIANGDVLIRTHDALWCLRPGAETPGEES